jgi:hypothetical protein
LIGHCEIKETGPTDSTISNGAFSEKSTSGQWFMLTETTAIFIGYSHNGQPPYTRQVPRMEQTISTEMPSRALGGLA